MKSGIIFCLMLFLIPATLIAQEDEPESGQFFEKFKSEEFNVGALFQMGGVYSIYNDGFNGGRKYDLKTARLYIEGDVESKLNYRFKLDFGEQISIREAYIGYRLTNYLRFNAGAVKPYLSRDLEADLGSVALINRARHTSIMTNKREIGVTLIGDHRFINYRLGVYNGTGLTGENDSRFLYTSRIGIVLGIWDTEIHLGVSGALNMTNSVLVGNTDLLNANDQFIYGGYLEFRSTNFFSTFEFLQTRFNALNLQGREETINGLYGTLGVNLGRKNQLLTRVDYIDFNLMNQISERVIVGWNYQATNLLTFRLNILAQFDNDKAEQFGVESVLQLQF